MSRPRRNIRRRKLDDLLSRVSDEAFFIMCWATFAVQSGRADNARDLLSFPSEAIVSDLTSPWCVHPWRIETLLNEVLTVPKLAVVPGKSYRILNCGSFAAMRAVLNELNGLENAEDAIVLRRVNVMRELHRLGQRQFEWQRGFLSLTQLYRSGFIYGGELTKSFFVQANGLSIEEFALACFSLRVMYLERPAVTINGGLDQIGLSESALRLAVDLISLTHAEARTKARALRAGGGHTAYRRSLLRMFPCIRFDAGRTVAPLPDLVTLRGTSGLFYDAVKGGDDVRNEISGRFEKYCCDFLAYMLPDIRVRGSYKYIIQKGRELDTPDVLLYEANEISIVFECKATRMSYQARFSEAPLVDDPRGYAELTKGVFQIWRFVSHHRRGLVRGERIRSDVKGVVLTLDTWLSMATEMQREVLTLAKQMAVERDGEIVDEDRIPIVFCPVEHLEQTLSVATTASFLETVKAAATEPYEGWMLWNVHREVAPGGRMKNSYPFAERISEVLPWWSRFGED